MRQLVDKYKKLKKLGDNKCDLQLKRIRLKHPIFNLLTNSAFKYLVDTGNLLDMKKPGQTVYREG